MVKTCWHCKKREALARLDYWACLFCFNTGHQGKTIADCPKCPKSPNPTGDGEKLAGAKESPLKRAA